MQSNGFFVEFESIFNDNYLRNNKCDGEKNIRCFPQCCSTGHCKVGFCGSSVNIVLTAHGISSEAPQPLTALGELLPDDCQPSFLEESIITQAMLDKQAKYSKYYTTSKTISLENNDPVHIQFNSNPKSWGYSYVGHRFKKDQKHKFVVSFLIKTSSIGEDNTYKCVGTFDSKSFNMQCKRRAKTYSPIIGGTELNKSTVCTNTAEITDLGPLSETASNVPIKALAVKRASSDCTLTMITDSESPITIDELIPLKEKTAESIPITAPIRTKSILSDNASVILKEQASKAVSFDFLISPKKSPEKYLLKRSFNNTKSPGKDHGLPPGLMEFSPFVHFTPILSPADVTTSSSIACSTISVTDSAVRSKPCTPKAAPWPIDTPSNPFGSVGGLDHWCPSYEEGKMVFPKATQMISSRRMAMMQQLFPKRDITLFYKV